MRSDESLLAECDSLIEELSLVDEKYYATESESERIEIAREANSRLSARVIALFEESRSKVGPSGPGMRVTEQVGEYIKVYSDAEGCAQLPVQLSSYGAYIEIALHYLTEYRPYLTSPNDSST
ncbi:MAG: hypothetical protein J0H49_10695 [Acidobacteria bacterium]|nr:hypothetical protein [Acidobacteriota bacterium]